MIHLCKAVLHSVLLSDICHNREKKTFATSVSRRLYVFFFSVHFHGSFCNIKYVRILTFKSRFIQFCLSQAHIYDNHKTSRLCEFKCVFPIYFDISKISQEFSLLLYRCVMLKDDVKDIYTSSARSPNTALSL